MGKFDISTYNKLHTISAANARFERQLTASGITRAQLFTQLAPLFMEDATAGRYAACLIHSHYQLKDGERMVANGNSTAPSRTTSPNIVAERWLSTGEEMEHRFTEHPDSLPPPPSADFLARFTAITKVHGIDILGVCYAPAPTELAPGFMWLEAPGLGDREQFLTMVPYSPSPGKDTYQSTWIPKVNPDDQCCEMECTHSCCGIKR